MAHCWIPFQLSNVNFESLTHEVGVSKRKPIESSIRWQTVAEVRLSELGGRTEQAPEEFLNRAGVGITGQWRRSHRAYEGDKPDLIACGEGVALARDPRSPKSPSCASPGAPTERLPGKAPR
ncbi:MAG: hypothetical protein RL701_8076 [Pseudomonadota bacterium]